MRITGSKSSMQMVFDSAFALVGKGVMPSLAYAYLMVTEDSSYLVGSNGGITTVVSLDSVSIEDPTPCLFPPIIQRTVRLCDSGLDVVLDCTDDLIKVTCGDFSQTVRTELLEYPEISWATDTDFSIPKEELEASLRRVQPAIQSASVRPLLNFIQITDNHMQACDGSKMMRVPFPYGNDMLIPGDAVSEILKRIRAMSMETVQIGENDAAIVILFDNDRLIMPKSVDSFPDLNKAFIAPTEDFEAFLSFPRVVVEDAVKRVALTADTDTNYLQLDLTDGSMRMSSLDKFGWLASEELNVSWDSGDRELGVNHQYFSDILGVLSDDTVSISLGPDDGAILSFIRFDQESDGFLAILTRLHSQLGASLRASRERAEAGE